MSNTPEFPHPVPARLDEVHLLTDNSLRVWLELEGGSKLCVDIPAESDAMSRVVEALAGATTEMLSAVGQRGLEVVGFTEIDHEPEDDEEEDQQ